jgi:hypothetical protein
MNDRIKKYAWAFLRTFLEEVCSEPEVLAVLTLAGIVFVLVYLIACPNTWVTPGTGLDILSINPDRLL